MLPNALYHKQPAIAIPEYGKVGLEPVFLTPDWSYVTHHSSIDLRKPFGDIGFPFTVEYNTKR